MARFKNNPFPGVDVSQYTTWPQVTLPNGEVYYQVPGHPGYVYDPVSSNATGDSVFRANPAQDIKAQNDATQQQQDLVNAQKKANSPATQLGTIAGVGGITAGIPIVAKNLFPSALEQAQTAALAPKVVPSIVSNANIAAQGAGGVAQGAQFGASAADQVGNVALTDPSVAGFGNIGAGESAADTALNGGAEASLDATQAGTDAAASGGAGVGGLGFGPLAAIAGATYLGGKSAYDELQGKTDNSIPGLIGRGSLDIATGGLAELARPFLGHVTTKQSQQKQVSNLASRSDDPTWQSTISALGQSVANGPVDPTKPFSDGQGNSFATFQDYKNSTNGLNASNLALNPGNLDLYGPDFVKLTPAQQQAITQANINDDNYDDKKGAIVIKDPVKAKANYDSIVGGASPAVTTSVGTAPIPAVSATTKPAIISAPGTVQVNAPAIVPAANATSAALGAAPTLIRTKTVSPGIGLNGQRISY